MKCLSYNYDGKFAFKVSFDDVDEWLAFEEWFMNVGKDLFEEFYAKENDAKGDK